MCMEMCKQQHDFSSPEVRDIVRYGAILGSWLLLIETNSLYIDMLATCFKSPSVTKHQLHAEKNSNANGSDKALQDTS